MFIPQEMSLRFLKVDVLPESLVRLENLPGVCILPVLYTSSNLPDNKAVFFVNKTL